MSELNLIKAEVLKENAKDELNAIIYQKSKQRFIRISKQISK